MNGILLIDKEPGISSFDVIRRIKHHSVEKLKIGHAGTLDPFASGLLVILLGRATKTMGMFHKMRKGYSFTVEFGYETDTLDPTGEKIFIDTDQHNFTPTEIKSVLLGFRGEQTQIPPIYSAKKVKGKRAYDIARKGGTPVLEPIKVNIYKLEHISGEGSQHTFEATVSSGTYIRSLASDIGRALGSYATTTALRRTFIGDYAVTDAVPSKLLDRIELADKLLPTPTWKENVM